jgi:hypothetical protein
MKNRKDPQQSWVHSSFLASFVLLLLLAFTWRYFSLGQVGSDCRCFIGMEGQLLVLIARRFSVKIHFDSQPYSVSGAFLRHLV